MKKNAVWDPARSTLDLSIQTQCGIPDSYFTIIPFGDKPYTEFNFSSDHYRTNKKDISEAFDKYMAQANYTRISDVLMAGFAKCDPAKENRIYLLTDGQPNGGDSPQKVAQTISRWCATHTNTRLFYVALKPDAINEVIKEAVDACPDAYVVVCHDNVIPQITDISPAPIYANIVELPSEHNILFSLPGRVPLNITCDDPMFDAQLISGGSADGIVTVMLTAKGNPDSEALHAAIAPKADADGYYTFSISITSPDPDRFFVANPIVTVHMDDHLQTSLSLFDGTNEEIKADGCRWHDSFLWSDAAEAAYTEWDLKPKFKNLNGPARASFSVRPAQGQAEDYTVYFNGEEVGAGDPIDIVPGSPAMLRIEFNAGAAEGKRYFVIQPESVQGIDLINGTSPEEYAGQPIRTRYDEQWNPLKTLFFWLGIALLGLLVLWFAVLRRILYPTIKVARIELLGPGAYYQSARIKGKIKIVLTSRRRSQPVLSRLFCGQTGYVRAEHFHPEIEIRPGSKKKIRLVSAGSGGDKWTFSPSAILAPYEKSHADKESSNDAFDIETT